MSRNLSLAYLITLALISATALAYEVLLMHLFSIIQWHHFAYMIISLALLGYGISGTFLALNKAWLTRHFSVAILSNMVLFAVSLPVCFLVVQQIPFNPAEILWDPAQLGYLFASYITLTLPFFFAASIIGLSFYYFKQQVASIYAADLLGAGIGSIGIILLLYLFFPENIFTVLILMIVLAAGIFIVATMSKHEISTWAWASIFSFIIVAAWLLLPNVNSLLISPYKSQSQFLTIPEAKIIEQQSSPLGLITVVESKKTPLRNAPGLSIRADVDIPEQLAVFTDAAHLSAITQVTNNNKNISYLDQTTSALPYHLRAMDKVLILGAGTGSDVLQARFHKSHHIDAVEQNPQVIKLIKKTYADFAGALYSKSDVKLFNKEIRAFISSTDKRYDLVNLSLMDAFGSSSAGLYSMAENYLYTKQAVQQYLQHLTTDGYLSLTRWIKLPPRDMPKLMATVIQVLKSNGVTKPSQHIIVIRNWQTSTLLVKNSVITANEIGYLKLFCKQRNFDLVYYPGIKEAETNQFHIMKQPYLFQSVSALLSPQAEAFIENYKFNIEPSTDDKPYFAQFLKWKTLPEMVSLIDSGGLFLLESGYLILIATLIQAIIASVLLIAIPLWLWKKKLTASSQTDKRGLSYFFCLGLAFLFVEIAFIQRFVLILHHPIFAITTVLCTFLLSAGLGSYFSKRWASHQLNTSILFWPIAVLSALCITYILGFEWISHVILQQGDVSRYLLSVLLIAPLGFCMGMPFPLGLMQLSRTMPEMIPWAWAVNGCASVISAILAVIIAMEFGFSGLITAAVLLYCFSVLLFPTQVR
jgi:spermidine synthase